jgi:hypothetical protein
MLILANSRPYEGFALSLAAVGILGWRWLRGQPEWRVRFNRAAIAPFGLVFLAGVEAWRFTITGYLGTLSPFRTR